MIKLEKAGSAPSQISVGMSILIYILYTIKEYVKCTKYKTCAIRTGFKFGTFHTYLTALEQSCSLKNV